MQKFSIGIRGFMSIIAGTLVLLLIYFNTDVFEDSKLPRTRLFSETYRVKFKGRFVTQDVTKSKTTKSNPCTDVTIPSLDRTINMTTGFWQPVNNNLTAFVFSAYFIHELNKIVVIAMIRKVEAELYFCQFWHKGEDGPYILSDQTNAEIIRLPEDHGHTYSAAFFECSLRNSSDFPPSYVSMVDKKCTSPLNSMLAQHLIKPKAFSRNFTMCLSPLHTKVDIHRFIEWIEFNRILGADMFFVYRNTDAIKLNKVLDFYSKKGFMNIMHWNLPEKGPNSLSIHYFGQLAALNDCLYRNKYESEYIVNIDLDEYIIPRIENETSWQQMLRHVKKSEVGYIVRHTLFKMKEDTLNIKISNKTVFDENNKLITLQKVQREENISAARHRSKYFSRTSRVNFVQIHGVSGISKLPVNIGLLHHYREKHKNAAMRNLLIDRTVPDKFGDVLVEKVTNVWTELNRILPDHLQ